METADNVPTKILIIDDETGLRQSVAAYLEDSGFITLEASNGSSGLEIFKTQQPDLVITDLQMPNMHGLQVLSSLRQISPDTPVIVISGAGGMEDVIQALRHGAWDYFTKPIQDFTLMERAITRALDRRRLILENESYRQKLERSLEILEADYKAGRGVQAKLLPQEALHLGEYFFDYIFVPSLYLSGDFVDYFIVNSQTVGFYLADVSGHGVSSACVTVYLKSLMDNIQAQYKSQHNDLLIHPDKLLSKISQEIYNLKIDKYLTMYYGLINTEDHTLTYAIAGHYPSPILVDLTTNAAEFIKGSGFPVGVQSGSEYQTYSFTLPQKFSLICYSDGILERIGTSDLEHSEKRLLQLTQNNACDVKQVLAELNITDQDELSDDITVVTVFKKS